MGLNFVFIFCLSAFSITSLAQIKKPTDIAKKPRIQISCEDQREDCTTEIANKYNKLGCSLEKLSCKTEKSVGLATDVQIKTCYFKSHKCQSSVAVDSCENGYTAKNLDDKKDSVVVCVLNPQPKPDSSSR